MEHLNESRCAGGLSSEGASRSSRLSPEAIARKELWLLKSCVAKNKQATATTLAKNTESVPSCACRIFERSHPSNSGMGQGTLLSLIHATCVALHRVYHGEFHRIKDEAISAMFTKFSKDTTAVFMSNRCSLLNEGELYEETMCATCLHGSRMTSCIYALHGEDADRGNVSSGYITHDCMAARKRFEAPRSPGREARQYLHLQRRLQEW
ncbi:hypothetical protein SELMODRAFT_410891 [Selaginella moellendorffii]|uniref:Uncharacterized protein n=1 Tax=Selaginella moellendorffii TaxID=88036 RepID=D8RG74_SELML|nr:hypothetical protein SELMODRAFT_410891 [Selaginella moellendorffii]